MSDKNTGGPAFPHIDSGCGRFEEGMLLRDYFAAKAMQSTFDGPIEASAAGKDYIAMHAYKMADAMLKARDAK